MPGEGLTGNVGEGNCPGDETHQTDLFLKVVDTHRLDELVGGLILDRKSRGKTAVRRNPHPK